MVLEALNLRDLRDRDARPYAGLKTNPGSSGSISVKSISRAMPVRIFCGLDASTPAMRAEMRGPSSQRDDAGAVTGCFGRTPWLPGMPERPKCR